MENESSPIFASRKQHNIYAALRNRNFLAGLFLTLLFLFMAVFGPVFAPYDPYDQNLQFKTESFSREHLLGRDELGRDLLSRILYGARYSLAMAFAAVATGLTIGSTFGSISGFFGGIVDIIIMRITDIMLAFPELLLAIAISAILGPGYTNLIIAISIASIAPFTRLVRGQVLSLKEKGYVLGARAVGASNRRIILIHILPNCMAQLIVKATYSLALAIIFASGLSFLGLGAKPPTPEWGVMLSRGRDYFRDAPHIVAVPGIFITICILGLNLLGDGLRDVTDPRLVY